MENKIIKVDLKNVEINRHQNSLPENRKSVLELYPDTVDVTISVIAYNRLEKTKTCIESILKYTADINYKLILVYNENEAGVGILEYFQSVDYENKLIIHMTQNVGLGLATKEILKHMEGKYYIGLANDTIVTTNWLSNLIKCAESDERIGMVTPISSNVTPEQRGDLNFCDFDTMQFEAKKYNVSDPSKWEEYIRLITICPLLTRGCLEAIGNAFDIGFYHEFMDDELSFRVRRAGYKCILARDTWVHHDHPESERNISKELKTFELGRRYFREKYWGLESWGNVNNFQVVYVNAIQVSNSDCPAILGIDVKCGAPILQIKNKLRSFGICKTEMYAYTQRPEYYLDLQTVCGPQNVICGQEEEILLQFAGKKFDYIILGDYLNLYNNPRHILKQLSDLLNDNGQIFLSLKNVYDIFALFNILGHSKKSNNELYRIISVDDLYSMTSELGLDTKYLISYLHKNLNSLLEELLQIPGANALIENGNKNKILQNLRVDSHTYVITKRK